jgi:hypothetical protein
MGNEPKCYRMVISSCFPSSGHVIREKNAHIALIIQLPTHSVIFYNSDLRY